LLRQDNSKMNKKLCLFILLLSFKLQTVSAQILNSWVNYNQEYYKVAVSSNGIFRITFTELQNAGFPVSVINPQHLQLFHDGQEMAILVQGEGDGVFNTNDYIEFYGTRNDGSLDATMYDDPLNHTNPHEGLYTNQSYYFLTYTLDNTNGKRIETYDATANNGVTVTHHEETARINFFFEQLQTRNLERFFASGPLFPTFFQSISNQGSLLSGFDLQGKGFTDLFAGGNTYKEFAIPVSNYVDNILAPRLKIKVTGRSNTNHNVSLFAGVNSGALSEIGTLQFRNYENAELNELLSFNTLPTGVDTFYVAYQINPSTESLNEIISLSSIDLTYAQAFNMDVVNEKLFTIKQQNTPLRTINIENFANEMQLYNISDPSNIQLVQGSLDVNNTLTATLPENNANIILFATQNITKSIDAIAQTRISPITLDNAQYVIISNQNLMRPAGGESDVVEAYTTYRASPEGGNYRVLTVDIENLYNQFTYGEVSPVAIRRFIEVLFQRGSPEFLLLIGKGLSFNYNYEKNKPASLSWTYQSYIPCYGEPCSDNMFTAGLEDTFLEPAIATGRIPASTPQEVINYLNKVKAHEAFNNDALWKKQILHLSGGRSVSEHRELSEHVNNLAAFPRATLGADISFIRKETTATTEFIDISDEVNDGLGLMTFFGHSSLTLVDLEFGFVSNEIRGFNNKDRYPFLFMMGCNVGNTFTGTRSIGEDWLLTADKGCIGFLAHSYLAFVDTQERFSNNVYRYFFNDTTQIDQPIGILLKQAIKTYISENPNNQRDWSNAQQFVLSGDPAIRLFNFDKTDYATSTQGLRAETFDITTELDSQTDSFKIAIEVKNFGLVNTDSFEIAVSRTFPDGSIRTYTPISYPHVAFKDTLFFTIPVSAEDKIRGGGNNSFEVTLDVAQQIDEMDELNNTATLELFLRPRRIFIISPSEYAIVNEQPVRLFAQSAEEVSVERAYSFQLDTTAFFNSPAFRDTTVLATTTPFWETTLLTENPADSVVYYWRVRPAETTEESDWTNSSFIYIDNGQNGWSQSHPQQFINNLNDNLSIDENNGHWQFTENNIRLDVKSVGDNSPDPLDYEIFLNDFRIAALGICGENSIVSLAIDQNTGKPYVIPIFPQLRCGFGERGEAYRILDNDLRAFNAMSIYSDFIDEGDYVLFVATGNVRFSDFTEANYAGFANFGIDPVRLLNTLTSGDPYIALGRKGAPVGSAEEIFARYTALTPSNQQEITANFSFNLSTSNGLITSPRIGPSSNWQTLFQNITDRDHPDETFQTDLIGVRIQGEENIILQDITENLTDLSFINADTFPYLRLQTNLIDTISKTPMQLIDWKVLYEGVPEGILFRNSTENNEVKIVAEGDTVKYNYTFNHVSGTSFNNPVIVAYEILNNNTNSIITQYDTLGTLAVNDSLAINFALPTAGFAGENRLNVFVNPRLQVEQVFENNILEETFLVKPDTVNPLLDVLFNGVRILDGDIVSATPLITVMLKDENPFLTKNDTVGLELFLSSCDSCAFRKIALNSPEISTTSDDQNLFQLFFEPQELADGMYTLMVNGSDASGNESGVEPYRIRFEVINEARITHFYPYPNPFSDRVRFVFTLTGSEIPSGIKIQIMTVTGRVVREITQDELGPIRIGNNLTEYAWDGRDEFGDQLANGVYLYKVFLQASGEAYKHIETAGDGLFKNGYGKMYLMR